MSRDGEEEKGVCREFLVYLSNGNWAGAHDLLAEEFSAWFPQLGETISDTENYITKHMESGKLGPYQIHNTYCEYDNWDRTYTVTFQICLLEKVGECSSRNYKIMFFQLDSSGLISSITEFICPEIRKNQEVATSL
jgi:hypothetical protein